MKYVDKNKFWSVLVLAAAILLTPACKEEIETPDQQDSDDTFTETEIEVNFDEVEDMSISAMVQTDGGRVEGDGRLSCATLTREEQVDGSILVTVDFGDGCEGPHGRIRKGIIKITHGGNFWLPGSVFVIELVNYSVNNVKIEGIRTVTNATTEQSEGVVHEISLTGGKVTWPDETFATREVNKVRVWIRDANNPIEDIFKLTGTATGKNRRGVEYSMEITEPIIFKRSCYESGIWIPVQGIKTITTPRRTVSVNFGDGTCDREVVIVYNGNSQTITIGG